MPIRDCAVIAIDGTHASGKTTLIHALTAHYRRQGINVAAMSEPARSSPFIEEIVIHQCGSFDLAAEIDVFAYARTLLNIEPDTIEAAVLDAMETFYRAWAPTYDLVFLTHDHYSQPSDGFRAKVTGLQHTAATTTLRELYQRLDVAVHDVPLGYETAQRVEWIAGQVTAASPILPG